MKRLLDFFRSKKPAPEQSVSVSETRLADLEEESGAAGFGFRWVPLNRAGDLCERAGDRARALGYYGRAIDVLLEDGMPEPARGLATKIVRIHPAAVRTLCTLTWLDLASHHMASVVVHLNEYVERAQGGGRQEIAGEQIYRMAHVVTDVEFRGAAANALDALDCKDDAAEVRGWVVAGQAPHDGDYVGDWADLCISHALGAHTRQVDRRDDLLAAMSDHSATPEVEAAGAEEERLEDPGEVEDVPAQRDSTAEEQDQPEEHRA